MKIGVVGCGDISDRILNALSRIEEAKVESACDIVRERAVAKAKRYRIPNVYTKLSSMLERENLDTVIILTPPQSHASLSIASMNAGCHVLVEKPMCLTVRQADKMIETANRNNVKLGVCHAFLFTPAIREALEVVEQGEIGDLVWVDTLVSIYPVLGYSLSSQFPRWLSTLPGGLFGEIIPHGLYVQLAFLGGVKSVLSMTKNSEKATNLVPFSDLHVMMDCENAQGGLYLSTRINYLHTVMMVRVVGSKKILLVDVPSATMLKLKLRSPSKFSKGLTNIDMAYQLLSRTLSLGTKTLSGSVKPNMSSEILLEKFVENVGKGLEPPVTAEEGREVTKVSNMIWEEVLE